MKKMHSHRPTWALGSVLLFTLFAVAALVLGCIDLGGGEGAGGDGSDSVRSGESAKGTSVDVPAPESDGNDLYQSPPPPGEIDDTSTVITPGESKTFVQMIGNAPGMDQYRWWNQDFGWTHTFDVAAGRILSAKLDIRAWDVDVAPGAYWEHDLIYADGGLLGELQGSNYAWSVTSFNIDPALLSDGTLRVWVDIDSTHNLDWWAVTIDWSRLTVEYEEKGLTLEVAKAEIAAGGVNSAPHQTGFTISVTPPQVVSVTINMQGGVGQEYTVDGEVYIERRDASAVLSTGEVLSPGGQVVVQTSAEGIITGTLCSSNLATGTCTLSAQATLDGELVTDSETVTFAFGEQVVTIPELLTVETELVAEATRILNSQPLDGHKQIFYLGELVIDGQVVDIESTTPSGQARAQQNKYVKISPFGKKTGADGKAAVRFVLKDIEGLEEIEMITRDVTVFDPTVGLGD